MMSYIKPIAIIIFLIVCNLSAFAQEENSKVYKPPKSRIHIGAYLAITHINSPPAYRYYTVGSTFEETAALLKGINVGYLIKDNFSVQLGFEHFSVKYEGTGWYKPNFPPLSDPENYWAVQYEVNVYQFPLLLKTYLSNKNRKLRFYFPLGVVYRNQFAIELLEEKYEDGTGAWPLSTLRWFKTNFRDQFLSWNIAAGMQYTFKRKFSIFAEPTARHTFLYKNYSGEYKNNFPPSYGVNLGATFQF